MKGSAGAIFERWNKSTNGISAAVTVKELHLEILSASMVVLPASMVVLPASMVVLSVDMRCRDKKAFV